MNIQNPPQTGGNGAAPRGRKPRRTPKGRQVDPAGARRGAALLGDRSRRRDLLIEHLHLIQDKYGHISGAHLAALAAEMKLAQTEVYEVATFYAHFDVVKEGETPPPPVTVRVCELAVLRDGRRRAAARRICRRRSAPNVRVVRAPCMGACDRAPVCAVGHVQAMKATDSPRWRSSRIPTRMRMRSSPAPISSTTGRRRLRAAGRVPSPASARATS